MSDAAEPRVHKAQVNPDIDSISSLNLYEGQRVRHDLIYGVVKDRKSGAFHHDYVTFRTSRKTKQTPWKADPKASFTLSEDKEGELSKALAFLAETRGQGSADPASAPLGYAQGDPNDHQRLVEALTSLDVEDRFETVLQLLRDLRSRHEPRQVMALIEQIESPELAATAGLFQIGVWRRALREFHRLLKDGDRTPEMLCRHFAAHRWLIGAETSEPISLAPLLLPEADDLLLQRTADGWLELVIVRTPLAEAQLFHGDVLTGWFPVPELAMAMSRAQHLLEKIDPETLLIEDPWTLNGQRARLLIGHLHADPVQEMALQRFNRHARGIQVQSYDQIDRHAIKALTRLQQAGKAQA